MESEVCHSFQKNTDKIILIQKKAKKNDSQKAMILFLQKIIINYKN